MPSLPPYRDMPGIIPVRGMLSDLLGREVSVRDALHLDLDRDDLFSAILPDDEDNLSALFVCDLPFVCNTGGALSIVPAATVAESIEAGEPSELLAENYYEVANIMTGLLNGPDWTHIRITEVVPGVPDEARALADVAIGKTTVEVTIPGYGDGTMTMFAEP
ncbi:MAG: hypothetical protein AB8G26_00265 [Ilumatobacter sp.]